MGKLRPWKPLEAQEQAPGVGTSHTHQAQALHPPLGGSKQEAALGVGSEGPGLLHSEAAQAVARDRWGTRTAYSRQNTALHLKGKGRGRLREDHYGQRGNNR